MLHHQHHNIKLHHKLLPTVLVKVYNHLVKVYNRVVKVYNRVVVVIEEIKMFLMGTFI